jgi:hypothetical protein
MARLLKYKIKIQIMKLLRIGLSFFILILVVMGISNCEGSKSKSNQFELVDDPPFRIDDSYSQDWVAGIKQGGSGTNLYITLGDITESIDVQELYFKGKMVRSKISPSNRNQYIGFFKNELISDIIMDSDPVKESKNTPPQKSPFQLKDQEAVIGFLLNGVKHYYKFTDIEIKPPIAYPSNHREIDH